MAQHLPLLNTKIKELKGIRKAADSIVARASKRYFDISGSLRYTEILDEGHKMNPNDRVFITERTVNGRRELFELHYDWKEQKVLEIFFVS